MEAGVNKRHGKDASRSRRANKASRSENASKVLEMPHSAHRSGSYGKAESGSVTYTNSQGCLRRIYPRSSRKADRALLVTDPTDFTTLSPKSTNQRRTSTIRVAHFRQNVRKRRTISNGCPTCRMFTHSATSGVPCHNPRRKVPHQK